MNLDCYSDYWFNSLGTKPTKEIGHKDFSESYEMERMHVFKLESGKFATIRESGCSCYEDGDAMIDLFPTEDAAMAAFFKYQKERGMDNLDIIEDAAEEKGLIPKEQDEEPK